MASVIASQALISGAFSLTVQAVQLDYLPRLAILHTSAHHQGQVYVPLVNWALMIGCVGLVLGLPDLEQPRGRLRHRRHHHDGDHLDPLLRRRPQPLGLVAGQGRAGRDPAAGRRQRLPRRQRPEDPRRRLVPAPRRPSSLLVQMATWRAGGSSSPPRIRRGERTVAEVLDEPRRRHRRRRHRGVPLQGRRARRRRRWSTTSATTRSCTRRTILVAVDITDAPHADGGERRAVDRRSGPVCHQVVLRFGFMEEPDVPGRAGRSVEVDGRPSTSTRSTYFVGRESV